MKFVIAFTFVLSFVMVVVYSAPADFEDLVEQEHAHFRVKRFTCDVLSVEAKGVKLNHAACGVHCLFRGRTGGYCNGKRVCICR
ncbi:defensin, isoforms B and C [Anoplophora glabripennis]|uniref:defensin, isoforms B and C n=1 Tax=Anoplophora glabripennis TaxID=217634 RepID=UPI0008734E19|nr:defensin, isoforms B and C [Anoplophora glabripennis]